MKKNLLIMALALGFYTGVSFGQSAIQSATPDYTNHTSDPLQIIGGVPDSTIIGVPNGSPDSNNSNNSEDSDYNRKIFHGGGHVTVQDILGVTPDLDRIEMDEIELNGDGNSDNNTVVNNGNKPSGNNQTSINHSTVISVYPNPTSDNINVVTEGEIIFGLVEVIDLTGKMVKNLNNVSSHGTGSSINISVSDLRSGMYFIRFKTNKDTYVRKIQIKH